MKRTFALSIVLILSAFSSGQARASSPTTLRRKAKASLQHDVSVVRKLVQVYVTDKKGKPDHGPSENGVHRLR